MYGVEKVIVIKEVVKSRMMQSRKGLYQNGDLCAQAKMVSLTSWVREQLLPLGIPLARVVPGWSLRKWDI